MVTKKLELEVPRRIECRADVDDVLKEFQAQLSRYLRTHGIGDWEKYFNQANAGYEITPVAWVLKVKPYDIQRMVELMLDPSSQLFEKADSEERLRNAIPMVQLLNAYEQRLRDIERLQKRVVELETKTAAQS